MRIGVAGAGTVGSLLAWRAVAAGATVEVFDSGASRRCATAAAGMLSPLAELATADASIGALGFDSLRLWRAWLAELGCEQLLVERGSLLVAAGRDRAELERVVAAIRARADDRAAIRRLTAAELAELEPELAHLERVYHLAGEGHLDTDALLARLEQELRSRAVWHDGASVAQVEPGRLRLASETAPRNFDWVCDCRGLGAAGARRDLRPVRGEIIHVHAADVRLSRPVRLAHPRYPVYIVPRDQQRYLIGATELESGDTAGVTVRSALELLSAACALHPGFAEASIAELRTGLRPALPDNHPQLSASPGLVAINGMFRHGFLAGPAMVARAGAAMGLH